MRLLGIGCVRPVGVIVHRIDELFVRVPPIAVVVRPTRRFLAARVAFERESAVVNLLTQEHRRGVLSLPDDLVKMNAFAAVCLSTDQQTARIFLTVDLVTRGLNTGSEMMRTPTYTNSCAGKPGTATGVTPNSGFPYWSMGRRAKNGNLRQPTISAMPAVTEASFSGLPRCAGRALTYPLQGRLGRDVSGWPICQLRRKWWDGGCAYMRKTMNIGSTEPLNSHWTDFKRPLYLLDVLRSIICSRIQ